MKKTAGQILSEEIYQFLLWQCQHAEKFPRSHKFTIGDRLQSEALRLMSCAVEATYTKERRALLRDAQLAIEQLRFLYRLCFDLRLVNEKTYEFAARTLDAIGRGLGGWRKANDAQASRPSVRPDRERAVNHPLLEPREPRRELEQQSSEPPLRQSEQEHANEPEQQHRFPCSAHTLMLEPKQITVASGAPRASRAVGAMGRFADRRHPPPCRPKSAGFGRGGGWVGRVFSRNRVNADRRAG